MMGFSHVLRNGIHHCLSIHWSVCSGSKGVDNLCFHTYGEFFPYSSPPHPPSPKSPGPYLSLEGWYVWYNEEQVAQGQYVVSDTRCPPLSDCELEWGGAGQRPRRGQSPVEHRRTFVRPAWRSEWDAIEGWLKAFKSLYWGLRGLM